MAFGKANFKSKNPTGDKAFNAITKHVFQGGVNPPMAPGGDGDNDTDDQQPAGKPQPKGGKKSKGSGGKRYDTATQSFRSL
jgi:hypothetical protein